MLVALGELLKGFHHVVCADRVTLPAKVLSDLFGTVALSFAHEAACGIRQNAGFVPLCEFCLDG
ncbi:hypothetical protein [Kineosporia sp. NBRC 101677]|uniref:hypothetical protein n=1 Tax=Kineosporia sp. NBRC 101677 TaxID=3032197 RepID=UPI00255644FE|nr:hypothetical protein [Kineosporia sp. NBRC 101677]